ncbi:hypothetical protein BC827DRAFT_1374802 [Russula dissimulans]|nr:hypothetical protein BC827DRAFT_1374802 [Russula dissimulans]
MPVVDFEENAAVAMYYRLPAAVKFWHVVGGLYFWEFFSTLDYEWSAIRGRRPWRWTMWVYSLTRVSALLATILLMVCINKESPSICKVVPLTHYVSILSDDSCLRRQGAYYCAFAPFQSLAYLGFAAATLLIVLRIVAIWNKNKAVVRIAIGLWITNVAFLIQGRSLSLPTNMSPKQTRFVTGAIRLRFAWFTDPKECLVQSVKSFQLSLIVALITNIVLLLTVIVGLLRLRYSGGGSFGLQRFLWNQGIVWFLLAIVAEVPPVVFILNMNVEVNLMFQIPSPIVMSIVASRMHRGLTDYATETTEIISSGFYEKKKNIPIMKAKQGPGPAAQVSLDPMEVAVHTAVERYPASESRPESSQLGSDTDVDEQHSDKTKSIGLVIDHDLDLEIGVAK